MKNSIYTYMFRVKNNYIWSTIIQHWSQIIINLIYYYLSLFKDGQ